jgi:hypothetical protein
MDLRKFIDLMASEELSFRRADLRPREAVEPFVLCLPKTAEQNLLTALTEEELKRFPLFAALTSHS